MQCKVGWVAGGKSCGSPGQAVAGSAQQPATLADHWLQMEAEVANKLGVSPKYVTFKDIDIIALDSFKVTTTIMPPGKDGKLDVSGVMEKLQKADSTSENSFVEA